MSIISFDRLLSIVETVCEILLTAISKLKSPSVEESE